MDPRVKPEDDEVDGLLSKISMRPAHSTLAKTLSRKNVAAHSYRGSKQTREILP